MRYALGYHRDTSLADHLLPYVFDLQRHDPPRLINTAVRRNHQVTPWKILDTERNARLDSDEPSGALIVALLPNTCLGLACDPGRRHLVIAAANAPGQAAIRALLDGDALGQVHAHLGKPAFFTAIFEVETALDPYGRRVPTGRVTVVKERALRAAQFDRWPSFTTWGHASAQHA